MKTKFAIIPVLVAVIAIGGFALVSNSMQQQQSSVHGVLRDYSVDELTQLSDYAIIGTVESMTPVKVEMTNPGDDPRVYTDVVINVQEDLFKKYDQKQISVRVMGGEVPSLKMTVEDSPKFEIGKSVFVFVNGPEKAGYTFAGHNYVAGQAIGTYDLKNDRATQQFSGESLQQSELVSQVQQFKGI